MSFYFQAAFCTFCSARHHSQLFLPRSVLMIVEQVKASLFPSRVLRLFLRPPLLTSSPLATLTSHTHTPETPTCTNPRTSTTHQSLRPSGSKISSKMKHQIWHLISFLLLGLLRNPRGTRPFLQARVLCLPSVCLCLTSSVSVSLSVVVCVCVCLLSLSVWVSFELS